MGMHFNQLKDPGKVGVVRILIRRYGDLVERLNINVFPDGPSYSDAYRANKDYLEEALGYHPESDLGEIVKEKFPTEEKEQFFEIVSDLYTESWQSWTDYGWEYDAAEYLEKTEIYAITDKDDILAIQYEFLEDEIKETLETT